MTIERQKLKELINQLKNTWSLEKDDKVSESSGWVNLFPANNSYAEQRDQTTRSIWLCYLNNQF